ncbi:hypothetical protein SAMN05443432_104213 [Roseovarius litoreus]|uniref:Type IV pilus biogenesis protein PilP n=1 Tax=Roseovarius litoreus TaxID=1155722 RepID=A0A1M7FJJ0_9RHOB|nr:hypothetical protein [Roseovarius litoreus]SHM03958.1 hypothetical protein SAMN05443432_104213 [Roseovarius litoreus]
MKPNFALTLSFDGIGLLHRAEAGWHVVGEVSLDGSNLATELADLRAKGLALDPSGMTTQLVIPDEQIKFLSFSAANADHDALEQAVRDNLTGATPYALEDLVYDWSLDAGQVHVAAVARETLAEAEEFASAHAFNPVSFTAKPGSGQFAGAPWFGKTAQAGQHIPEGETLDPDTAPIHVIGPAPPPPADAAETADLPASDPADSAATPALADADPSDADTATPADAAPDLDDAQAQDAAPDLDAAQTPDEATAPDTDPDPEAVSNPQAPDEPEADQTPAAPPVTPPVAAPGADQTPAPAFRSIRATRDEPSALPAAPRLEGADRSLRTPDDAPPVTGQPEDALSERNASRLAASLAAEPQDRLHPAPAEPPAETSAASFFFARRSSEPVPATVAAPPPPADEKQRMTIFGAREPVEVGGKPRYLGLILTALLLLFLIVVAAWASVFAEDGIARLFRSAPEPQIAQVPKRPDPAPLPAPAQTQPAPTDLAALPDADANADASAPATTDTSSLTARPDPTELSPDEALARYAATGIWLMAPEAPSAPGLITLDDFYQTSIDTRVRSSDAVALPDMDSLRHEARPQTPPAPAPAGTRFTVDERGLVVATPEGALTPQGVRVFAGRPALTPPALPDRPTAIASALPEAETSRLLGVRPQLRPDTLAEQNERASLGAGGRSLAELATLRPRLRPPSAQQTAQQAAAPTPNVDPDAVAAALAEAASEPDPFASATPQAVTASLKPNPRPNNFDRTVARTREAEQATPVAANQRMAPSAPTATTVARAATDQNVISLRQVNLIGVYGTPTNRRALVRLANGRYEKVKVGDRLDGGQVAAIGNDELRYLKRGRNIVLKMPRG